MNLLDSNICGIIIWYDRQIVINTNTDTHTMITQTHLITHDIL